MAMDYSPPPWGLSLVLGATTVFNASPTLPICSLDRLLCHALRAICSMVHWAGDLSGRQRRIFVPCRKRFAVT